LAFGATKNDGQEKIIFSLTVNVFLIFRKRLTILKTVNHSLDLNILFLHTRLWESVNVGHCSLLVARIYCRRSSNFGIRLPESGGIGWIPAIIAQI
jgi:hypothetical protein